MENLISQNMYSNNNGVQANQNQGQQGNKTNNVINAINLGGNTSKNTPGQGNKK